LRSEGHAGASVAVVDFKARRSLKDAIDEKKKEKKKKKKKKKEKKKKKKKEKKKKNSAPRNSEANG